MGTLAMLSLLFPRTNVSLSVTKYFENHKWSASFKFQNNFSLEGKRALSNVSPMIVFSEKRPCVERMAIGGSSGRNLPLGGVILNVELLEAVATF